MRSDLEHIDKTIHLLTLIVNCQSLAQCVNFTSECCRDRECTIDVDRECLHLASSANICMRKSITAANRINVVYLNEKKYRSYKTELACGTLLMTSQTDEKQ
jgi:hypothetical protein